MADQGTILYTPGVKILIACTSTGQMLDISDDIESGNLTLNENNPHSLNVTVSNANGKYGGIFMPNDKVIVQMKRLTWLQTFAGYLNEVPYFQVYPGSINLSASCTLKRLKYHYWDPGYQDVIQFVANAFNNGYGNDPPAGATVSGPNGVQIPVPSGDILGSQGLQQQSDAGMKGVLMSVLTQICNWPSKNIHIGGIPTDWINQLEPLWNDLSALVAGDIFSQTGANASTALGTGTTVAGINVGPGTQWTCSDWAAAVIQMAGGTVSANTVNAMIHWMNAEEPNAHWWNGNSNNPLNLGPGLRVSLSLRRSTGHG